MNFVLTNWKTSLTGVLILVLGALGTFLGIKVPGFNLDFGAALPIAIGMIFSKDGNVSGTG